MMKRIGFAGLALATLLGSSTAFAQADFGATQQQLLERRTSQLFGFGTPLATVSPAVARADGQPATDRQRLASGLTPAFVARNVAVLGDMISFWPDDLNYTHLMVCIEQGRSGLGAGPIPTIDGQNAGVQSVNVTPGPNYGEVKTILHGMDRCDGIRTTPWGSVLATEETDDGAAYEIIDPLNTDNHWVANRATGDIRDGLDSANPSTNVVKRTALATMAWEGLEVLDNGVVIGGDELRSGGDADGGAIFRFVPDVSYNCGLASGSPRVRPNQLCPNVITNLADSPFVSGTNYALYHGCGGVGDVGQGCEYGSGGRWVEVGATTARADADARGATGFCRPEDLHIDKDYGAMSPTGNGTGGILYCWTNTCGGNRGEALCSIESDATINAQSSVSLSGGGSIGLQNFLANGTTVATTDTRRFVENDARMRNHDNLEFQPTTRNVYIIEDDQFGEIWACLPDGTDRDLSSDGCVSMMSVSDPSAEPTGFIFDGTGRTAFYIVQHGQQPAALLDFTSNTVNGQTDDLIMITGFTKP